MVSRIIWKPLKWKAFKHYEISNYGEVKNTKTGYRTFGHMCTNGVLRVQLTNLKKVRTINVSKLVLLHFKKKEYNKNYALHLNLIITDNRDKNLEWSSLGDRFRYQRTMANKKRGAYVYNLNEPKRKYRAAIKDSRGKYKTIGYYETKDNAYTAYYNTFKAMFGYLPWTEDAQ